MRPALRWVLVTVILGLALLVAFWPRAGPATAPVDASPVNVGPVSAASAADIERLRSRAALQPCPAPPPGARPVRGPMTGLVLPCLGQPGTVDMATALAGRPALLNLWGPSCQPCAQELPALAAYAAEPSAVPVLGVEVQGQPEGALHTLTELGVHYPSVSDPDGRLRAALGAPPVIPLTYLVSADGQVKQLNPPEVMRSPEQVRAIVARYLGPGATG